MSPTSVKEQLYHACETFIDKRLKVVKNSISDIEYSLTSETKSSAGDKHETGRAMLQLEREKAGKQLAEIQTLKRTLSKVDIYKVSKTIRLGSLVYTSANNYFVAISAGKIQINQTMFYAVSPHTPIGQHILTKHIGDNIRFRTDIFIILKIE